MIRNAAVLFQKLPWGFLLLCIFIIAKIRVMGKQGKNREKGALRREQRGHVTEQGSFSALPPVPRGNHCFYRTQELTGASG